MPVVNFSKLRRISEKRKFFFQSLDKIHPFQKFSYRDIFSADGSYIYLPGISFEVSVDPLLSEKDLNSSYLPGS